MRHGNPNQQKILKRLRQMGYSASVKHNQIHVAGVTCNPFWLNATLESGYRVPDGQTIGMTMNAAKEFIRQAEAHK